MGRSRGNDEAFGYGRYEATSTINDWPATPSRLSTDFVRTWQVIRQVDCRTPVDRKGPSAIRPQSHFHVIQDIGTGREPQRFPERMNGRKQKISLCHIARSFTKTHTYIHSPRAVPKLVGQIARSVSGTVRLPASRGPTR
ncbi:hypothetical protein CEXT_627251 [Caerostris extrusa]|uniref:Uncharacterized protein n=1 Tax=Caerostris extrusa TaxID=172846 RepID=A0AAV4R0L7_CAEEX|nr:hypothetical protein CEXT_627251 [Caerostris extrusa]